MNTVEIEPDVIDAMAKARPVNKGGLYYLSKLAALLAIYAAVGAFAHVQFYRRDFDQHDLLSWAWIGAWPLGLLVVSLKWIAIGVGVLLALGAIAWLGLVVYKTVELRIWRHRHGLHRRPPL